MAIKSIPTIQTTFVRSITVTLMLCSYACTGLGIRTSPSAASRFKEGISVDDVFWTETEHQTPGRGELRVVTCQEGDLWIEANDGSDWNGTREEHAPRLEAARDLLVTPQLTASNPGTNASW